MKQNIQKEKENLRYEIALSKKLLLNNMTSVSINPLNKSSTTTGITDFIGSHPIQSLYLVDKVSDVLLPGDHKINKTIKGIRRGVEVIDELLTQ